MLECAMSITLAFDVYGTLIDTQGVVAGLQRIIGDKAASFSQAWRDKQLEYSFRRGLMQNYADFGICTSQALDYTCLHYNIPFSEEQKAVLLASYGSLPAFGDVTEGLSRLQEAGFQLYAFSNGAKDAVGNLLETAGISRFFDGVVSCDDIRTFKPNPAVYSHFLKESNSSGEDTWLVSSNPFDVIGAVSAGLRAAWVRRSGTAIFDPWDIEPTAIVRGLGELHTVVAAT
jgi:2-haloacid dehalogenase